MLLALDCDLVVEETVKTFSVEMARLMIVGVKHPELVRQHVVVKSEAAYVVSHRVVPFVTVMVEDPIRETLLAAIQKDRKLLDHPALALVAVMENIVLDLNSAPVLGQTVERSHAAVADLVAELMTALVDMYLP